MKNLSIDTLHITIGECSAYALRQVLPEADIVPFNEAICEGACCRVVGSADFKQLRSLSYNVNVDEYLGKSSGELDYGLKDLVAARFIKSVQSKVYDFCYVLFLFIIS